MPLATNSLARTTPSTHGVDDPFLGVPPSLRFDPGTDVLAMLCVSGGNQYRLGAPALLRSLMDLTATQNARLWVQMFDTQLQEPLQPATPDLLNRLAAGSILGGGTNLERCLSTTIAGLHVHPLPNGQRPQHLVLACNGFALNVFPPDLMGRTLPTTLLLPLDTPFDRFQLLQERWKDVAVVHVASVDVLLEQRVLRETVDDVGRAVDGPSVRPRL